MKSLTQHINENHVNESSIKATISDFEKFAKESGLKIKSKSLNSLVLSKPNSEKIKIDLSSSKKWYLNGEESDPEEIYDELSVAQYESLEEIVNEAGIFDIVKKMKQGDLVEIISAVGATEDFAKSAAKREIVNQLNKRGLLPDKVAKVADTYYKFKPLAKKVFESKTEEVYFDTYTASINAAVKYAEKRGFYTDDDDRFRALSNSPRPKDGKTSKVSFKLFKNEKEIKKMLHISVYNRGTNRNAFELTCYIN